MELRQWAGKCGRRFAQSVLSRRGFETPGCGMWARFERVTTEFGLLTHTFLSGTLIAQQTTPSTTFPP